MKVLLHIGQSKTGTSAIQAYLTLNRAALEKQGVLYPVPTRDGMPIDIGSHNGVADSLTGVSRFPFFTADQYFAEFFSQARSAGHSRMILSAEHFFGGEPRIWDVSDEAEYWTGYRQKLKALADHLHGHDLHVLVYLRDQLSWVASAIAQTIRSEGLVSDRRRIYQNDAQFFDMAKPVLRYASLLDVWRDVLRPTQLDVVPYDRKSLHQGSSIADFLKRAGIDASSAPSGSTQMSVNLSLTREYLEVKKLLNAHPRTKTSERVAIKVLERLSLASAEPTTYDLDPSVRESVVAFAEEENARLLADYGVRLPIVMPEGAPRLLTAAEIEAAMARFEAEVRRPKYRLLYLDLAARAFARRHARSLHAILHQAKRMHRKRRAVSR